MKIGGNRVGDISGELCDDFSTFSVKILRKTGENHVALVTTEASSVEMLLCDDWLEGVT